jgi:carbonic anhydrase
MRNAAGAVARDSLRSLLVSMRVPGLREITVINHTNCRCRLFAVTGRSAKRGRSESISEGHRPSGSRVLCNLPDFPDETGLHVENKTPHRNFFGDPWM